ncbi:NAD(P)H-hydrate dehydratase [Cohnella hashimotonis]|uniref:Bifunctional NAD(P)H-hydrate repair enzyme n=1 Tax=Cohnella hashimotonis TaxID=2826895 RepID=A0ABT6TMZ0_9BACL|nr:NAD(P)H-hydrate dehydratase [Cohnella hashimotonis]MDI4647289.1 NAD(P)H-hydrate dehydratase [Cohnella hashimotonis]
MELVTSAEMRAIDARTIEEFGIPQAILMENAGRAVAEEARRHAGAAGRGTDFGWLVLAGKGNNGGDGLVCARHLRDMGCRVAVLYAESPDRMQGAAALQRDIAARLGIPARVFAQPELGGDITDAGWFDGCDGLIDALLGTGSAGEPREPYASLIEAAVKSGLPVVAVDIPSGLDADTGAVAKACIRAESTVALAYAKRGLHQHPGAAHAGEVVVRRIGIPAGEAERAGVNTYLLNADSLQAKLGLSFPLPRTEDSHKGTYGHVLVAAGSALMSGAGLLSARAALRAGSGLVSWAQPAAAAPGLRGFAPEIMLRAVQDEGTGEWRQVKPERLAEAASGADALVIGPGMGRWEGDGAWLRSLLERVQAPVLVDADALNMIADACAQPGAWPQRNAPTVITPHPGEMARLAGLTVPQTQRDRIGLARDYAARHGVTVVLKGARTVVASPDGRAFVNTTGNPGMATGGAGDALAGIIGSLLGQGLNALEAAAYGVYWHGLAGDRAAASRPQAASLIAGDIVEAL